MVPGLEGRGRLAHERCAVNRWAWGEMTPEGDYRDHWDAIEAPYIYKHDGHYYLFVSLGMCCRGINSTYHTRVGRSESVTGPYLDKDGKDLLLGGGTNVATTVGPFIGPGHAGIIEVNGKSWFSCHFYDGTARGASKLSIRPLTWIPDGWPELGTLDDQSR